MADDKLQKMVEIAETNISQLFQDDTSMQKFLEFMQKNEHLTYYAASMIDGTDYADTYDGWKERGYQVNAGEHGTPIFVKRSTVKRKFIDENGTIRNLSSASYIERQKIKDGELKVSSNLSSYYTVEHLFSKEQTNAKNVDFEVEKRPSILTYEDIKTVVEESTDDILDVDFAMPSPIIKCATGYATYMLCISDNVIDSDLYKKAKNEFAEYKDKLSLSEQKLVLNSVLKIVRSDHTRELLNVFKNEIRESKKIVADDVTDLVCLSREFDKGTKEVTYIFNCNVRGAANVLTFKIVKETYGASFSLHTENDDIWDNLSPKEKEKLESRVSDEADFFTWKQKIDIATTADELKDLNNAFLESENIPRSVSLRIADEIGKKYEIIDKVFFDITIDGHKCRQVDKWKSGTCTYTLGVDIEDKSFFYASVLETLDNLNNTYNYEFDYKPIRENVEIKHLNEITMRDIDNREAVYGADGALAFPNLNEEKPESSKKNKIEDFGKKIGGARKDLWKQRGLMVEDLEEMNIGEKNKYAIKNNIFPKPDYQKMVDDGLPVRTAYFIKTVRDAMPAKPVFNMLEEITDELTEKKIEGYVKFISEFKDILLNVKTNEDILNFYDNHIKDIYVERKSTYSVNPTEKSHGCMTNKLLKACQVSQYDLLDFDNKIKKKKFCYTKEQLKYDGFEICKFDDSCKVNEDRGRMVIERKVSNGKYFYYPEGELADINRWIKDTYFVLYKNSLVANALTKEQAQNTVDKMANGFAELKKECKEATKRTGKKKYVPEQLKHIERTGPSNGINEYNHADGQMYLDTFGFAGGEFGNWMNETDRQASLDFGYDALLDLADALEIDPKDISFDGELSIAFGSRGIAGAAAHYEPLRQVINLTKMHGAGSLAHEWGHALDNIISKKIKGKGIDTWLTDCKINDAVSSVKELVNSMKYRPATLEDKQRMKDKRCNESEKLFQDDFKWFFKSYTEKLLSKFESNIDKLLKGNSFNDDSARKLMDEIGDEYKLLSGNELRENAKNSLIGDMKEFNDRYNQTVDEIICPSQKTEYYKNSIEFDRSYRKESKGYWQDKKEMFARAFACYVKDKLDYRSDYLCGHADSYITIVDGKIIKAFPEGEERKAFNKGFDKVIDQLKEIGVLHHNRNQVRRKSR